MQYHILQKDGPVYLSADVGLGKTSIAQRLHDEIASDRSKKVVLAYAPNLRTANQFIRFISDAFEVRTARSYAETLANFERFLIGQYKAGITPVLIVDEAQNLTRDILKTIHHLFNFSTPRQFLIQVALVGQPELRDRIKRFKSLASRMYKIELNPFDLKQTDEMMRFRWTVAGGKGFPFDRPAIAEIHRLTGGVAREICKLASEALLRSIILRTKKITKEIISEAASSAFEEGT